MVRAHYPTTIWSQPILLHTLFKQLKTEAVWLLLMAGAEARRAVGSSEGLDNTALSVAVGGTHVWWSNC